ncbi:Clp protease N-terminal domain-containing protein [Streptomyces sp. NPDC051018]|uniref:Clp protease N-terminal domain-containing protein n=1 Tax=Streptomyces sp. NPDC051018 TaxID=3365639 RepID=UPI0037ACF6DA
MHHPVPRLPRQPVVPRAEADARLTAELASVVEGARRRALRDGDRQIDTAHLLHSLLESDPEVRALFRPGPGVARVLGYLVQRSIGYGLRWQGSVEDSGAVPVVRDVPAAGSRTPGPSGAGWSPSAATAMEGALRRAESYGRQRAAGVDLFAALAADPECRAMEVLRGAGIDIRRLDGLDPGDGAALAAAE